MEADRQINWNVVTGLTDHYSIEFDELQHRTGLVGEFASNLQAPDAATSHNGRLYIGDTNGFELWFVDPEDPDNTTGDFGNLGGFPVVTGQSNRVSPQSMASHDGKLLVVDRPTGGLYNVDPSDPTSTSGDFGEIGDIPSSISAPNAMVSHGGNLYIVDSTNGNLWRINPTDPDDETGDYGMVGTLPSTPGAVHGMASDGTTVYAVYDSGTTTTLYSVDLTTPADSTSIGDLPSDLDNARCIAYHGDYLYVGNNNPTGSTLWRFYTNLEDELVPLDNMTYIENIRGEEYSIEDRFVSNDHYVARMRAADDRENESAWTSWFSSYDNTMAPNSPTNVMIDVGTKVIPPDPPPPPDPPYDVDHGSGFYISNFENNSINKFEEDGSPGSGFSLDAPNLNPTGMTATSTRLLVLDIADNKVYFYDYSQARVHNEDFNLDSNNNFPQGIVTTNDRIYVVDSGDNKIYVYGSNGDRLGSEDFNLHADNDDARGLTGDDNHLYVLDSDTVYIYNFDGTRPATDQFGLDSTVYNSGITIGPNGVFYILTRPSPTIPMSGSELLAYDSSYDRLATGDIAIDITDPRALTYYDFITTVVTPTPVEPGEPTTEITCSVVFTLSTSSNANGYQIEYREACTHDWVLIDEPVLTSPHDISEHVKDFERFEVRLRTLGPDNTLNWEFPSLWTIPISHGPEETFNDIDINPDPGSQIIDNLTDKTGDEVLTVSWVVPDDRTYEYDFEWSDPRYTDRYGLYDIRLAPISPSFYTFNSLDHMIYKIDPSNRSIDPIGNVGTLTDVAAMAIQDSTIYIAVNNDNLYSFNLLDASTTSIAPLPINVNDIQGMTFHNGTLYIIDANTDSLYTVDISDATTTLVGALGVSNSAGLASHDGELYMTDRTPDGARLYTVNTSNGSASRVSNVNTNDIMYSLESYNGTLYGASREKLYIVDTSRGHIGVFTERGYIGPPPEGGVAVFEAHGLALSNSHITRYEIDCLDNNETYDISVRGGLRNERSDWVDVQGSTVDTGAPDVPTNLALTQHSFDISSMWDEVAADLDRYDFGWVQDAFGTEMVSTLYAVDNSTDSLYTVDTSTGMATLVGSLGINDPAALASHNEILYVADISNDNLYTVDVSDATTTLVGSLGLDQPRGMTFHNGTLYAVDNNTDSLYTVDISDASTTLVGSLGAGITTPQALASHEGTLYVTDSSRDLLYSVDTSTGSATQIGDLGVPFPAGMASHEGVMYLANSDRLVTLDTSDAESTLVGPFGITAVRGLASYSASRTLTSVWQTAQNTIARRAILESLFNDVEYCQRVRSVDNQGAESDWTSPVCTTTTLSTDVGIPVNFVATDGMNQSIDLSWETGSGDGASYYEINYKTVSGSTWTSISNISGTTQNITPMTPELIMVRFRAFDASDDHSDWSDYILLSADVTPPDDPVISSVTAPDVGKRLVVDWNEPAGIPDHYILAWRLGTSGTWTEVENISTTIYEIENLMNGETYQIRVRAVDFSGNMSGWSDIETGIPVDTVPPSVPVGGAASTGDESLNVMWNMSTGEPVSYDLSWRRSGVDTWMYERYCKYICNYYWFNQ